MAKVYNKKVSVCISNPCEAVAQVSDCCRHSYRVFRFVLYDVTEKERVPYPPGVHTLFLNGGRGGGDPRYEASGAQFLF